MKKEFNKINTHAQKAIDDPKLLSYLKGDMSSSEQHAFEDSMMDDPFTEDAMEGLEALKHRDITAEVAQLKRILQQQVQKKQARKTKRNRLEGRWTLIAVIMLFLTLLVSYFVIRMIS